MEREGWEYDGHDRQDLNRNTDYSEDQNLDKRYEYTQVSIMLKRRRKTE